MTQATIDQKFRFVLAIAEDKDGSSVLGFKSCEFILDVHARMKKTLQGADELSPKQQKWISSLYTQHKGKEEERKGLDFDRPNRSFLDDAPSYLDDQDDERPF